MGRVSSTIDQGPKDSPRSALRSIGDDAAMLDVVTSANVACGFHAGDPLTLRRTCQVAAERGVTVGAQVGYRDLVGFGRRFLDMEPEELTADVLYQLGALDAMAKSAGTRVRYVKPHGALYHATVRDLSLIHISEPTRPY